MKRRHVVTPIAATVALLGIAMFAGPLGAVEQTSPDQRVAALKQSIQQSQARLHEYEWIETTTISLKGEEKGRKVMRCYYGADGKLEKLPVDGGSAPPPQQSGGRGGRLKQKIVENKKNEMQDYMERAAALVHQYVPLGQRERAFDLLEQAYRARELQLQNLYVSPGFDPLRSDPRFGDLLRRVGFPADPSGRACRRGL